MRRDAWQSPAGDLAPGFGYALEIAAAPGRGEDKLALASLQRPSQRVDRGAAEGAHAVAGLGVAQPERPAGKVDFRSSKPFDLAAPAAGERDQADGRYCLPALPAPSSIMNSGLIEKTSGTGTSAIAPQLVNKGSVLVSSGALDLEGAVSGNGADTVSGASTLEFDSTVGGGQTAGFIGGGGALDLIDPLGFAAKISGFAASDKVELSGDWVLSGFSETGNGNMGTLTLSSGSNHLSLRFLGDYMARDFNIASGATTIITHA
jgi:hypothetical protein